MIANLGSSVPVYEDVTFGDNSIKLKNIAMTCYTVTLLILNIFSNLAISTSFFKKCQVQKYEKIVSAYQGVFDHIISGVGGWIYVYDLETIDF